VTTTWLRPKPLLLSCLTGLLIITRVAHAQPGGKLFTQQDVVNALRQQGIPAPVPAELHESVDWNDTTPAPGQTHVDVTVYMGRSAPEGKSYLETGMKKDPAYNQKRPFAGYEIFNIADGVFGDAFLSREGDDLQRPVWVDSKDPAKRMQALAIGEAYARVRVQNVVATFRVYTCSSTRFVFSSMAEYTGSERTVRLECQRQAEAAKPLAIERCRRFAAALGTPQEDLGGAVRRYLLYLKRTQRPIASANVRVAASRPPRPLPRRAAARMDDAQDEALLRTVIVPASQTRPAELASILHGFLNDAEVNGQVYVLLVAGNRFIFNNLEQGWRARQPKPATEDPYDRLIRYTRARDRWEDRETRRRIEEYKWMGKVALFAVDVLAGFVGVPSPTPIAQFPTLVQKALSSNPAVQAKLGNDVTRSFAKSWYSFATSGQGGGSMLVDAAWKRGMSLFCLQWEARESTTLPGLASEFTTQFNSAPTQHGWLERIDLAARMMAEGVVIERTELAEIREILNREELRKQYGFSDLAQLAITRDRLQRDLPGDVEQTLLLFYFSGRERPDPAGANSYAAGAAAPKPTADLDRPTPNRPHGDDEIPPGLLDVVTTISFGAALEQKQGQWVVARVDPGSQAAGLKLPVGAALADIDGKSVAGKSPNELLALWQGDGKTEMKLRFRTVQGLISAAVARGKVQVYPNIPVR
jgi:hypothetical protein